MRTNQNIFQKGLAVLLCAALAAGQPVYPAPAASAATERGAVKSVLPENRIDEENCAPNQVIVRYRTGALKQKTGTQAILRKARAKKNVSKSFGAAMTAVEEEKDVATTADRQLSILSESLGRDFVLEDTVHFSSGGKELSYSLVSSDKYRVFELMKLLSENEDVISVMPNVKVQTESVPDYSLNDPYARFSYQQNTSEAKNTAGRQADDRGYDASVVPSQNLSIGWEKAAQKTGSEDEVVVAVVDSGVDATHEDLKNVMWQNPGNIGLSGENGYDFIANSGKLTDPNGHGTHCAGIIAAQAGNGTGVAGGAGNKTKIMGLRMLNADGSGVSNYLFATMGCFDYVLKAKQRGVNIVAVSNSWGAAGADGADFYQDIFEMLKEQGILLLFAASNDGWDMDTLSTVPAQMESENLVTVGSLQENGEPANYSNYGNTSVDVFTGGTNILSTYSKDTYLPSIYDPERMKKTTDYYGEFSAEQSVSGGTVKPVTGDDGEADYTEVGGFGAAQVRLSKGVVSELEIRSENYLNTSKNPAALQWTLHGLKAGDSCYLYFPYDKDVTTAEKDTYYSVLYKLVSGAENSDYRIQTGDMYEKKDGSLEILGGGMQFGASPLVAGIYRHATGTVASYQQSRRKDVASYGIGICLTIPEGTYADENDSAVICLDSIAVSKAGVKTSSFGKYEFLSGTSMACPAAAGAAALLSSLEPEKSVAAGNKSGAAYAEYLRTRLLSMTTHSKALEGKCLTEGYIDYKKFDEAQPVITDAYVLSGTNDILLKGKNLGNAAETEVQYARLAAENKEYQTISKDASAGMYAAWDAAGGETIVLHGAKELVGTYTRFQVKTGDLSGTAAFFLVNGVGKYVPVFTAEKLLVDVFTDGNGQNLYGLTNTGDVGKLDESSGAISLYDDMDGKATMTGQLKKFLYKYFGAGEYAYYNDNFSFRQMGTVNLGGVYYQFLDVTAGAENIPVVARMDVNQEKPEWGVSMMSLPKEGWMSEICALNGKIYSFGGEFVQDETGIFSRHIFCLNMKTWKWERIAADLPEEFFNINVCEYDGALYLICCQIYDENDGQVKDSKAVWKFDGEHFTKMKTEIASPFRHSLRYSVPTLHPALAAAKNGILGIGISVDGYGNSFRYDPKEDKLYPLWRTLENGLAFPAYQKAVVTAKGLYLLRQEGFDMDARYAAVYHLDQESDTFEAQYEPAPTPSVEPTPAPMVSKEASKAKLAAAKKTIKRGKSYKIKVKNANGQKVSFSVSKKTKKRGVTVSSSGKVSVKKKAKKGKYKVTVKVQGNAQYKAKTLIFTAVVK